MLEVSRWRLISILIVLLITIGYSIPSFFPKSQTANWPAVVAQRISLGLDLSGGSQLLLEADAADLAEQRVEAMVDKVRTRMRRAPGGRIEISDISQSGGQVSFLVRDAARLDTAVDEMRQETAGAGMTGQRDWDVSVIDSTRIVLRPTAQGEAGALDEAIATARDVVARRIDPDGTKEVTVIRQGGNRILVQVPGVEDPNALKELIGKTARLEFKLVDLAATQEQLAAGRAPIGSEILQYVQEANEPPSPFVYYPPTGQPRIAVRRSVMVSGDQINNAQSTRDEDGQIAVALTFNQQGGRRFGQVTQANVNKPFAIILDDVVLSAPNIRQPILGGNASISGGFETPEEAEALAVQLRSGKLPVELRVVDERSVSAELGRDSIVLGTIAAAVAALAVILFLFLTYGSFAIFANIALVLNVFMILGIMAIMNATLTLPGLAGFVLTVGAAVDANVLINERIKEELRRGRKLLDAIDHGFKEASTAIFDANITNTIAGALLYYFGSGPVKGFAVVLIVGIVTSYFTAVVVVRAMVALWIRRARPKRLSL